MRTLRGPRGLAPIILVVIIAWALAAVLMLTGTLLSAQAIDEDVRTIARETGEIDGDLDGVRLAGRTAEISGRILQAAAPLAGELDQTIVAARRIDRKSGSILRTARSINVRVLDINQTVESINGRVESINANARGIEATVDSIQANARGIADTVDSIEAHARSIDSRVDTIAGLVDSIDGRLGGTLRQARTIDIGVAGINGRASRIIRIVRPIAGDFIRIVDEVGQPGLAQGHRQRSGDLSIHGHANSIDCRLGGQYCNDSSVPSKRSSRPKRAETPDRARKRAADRREKRADARRRGAADRADALFDALRRAGARPRADRRRRGTCSRCGRTSGRSDRTRRRERPGGRS